MSQRNILCVNCAHINDHFKVRLDITSNASTRTDHLLFFSFVYDPPYPTVGSSGVKSRWWSPWWNQGTLRFPLQVPGQIPAHACRETAGTFWADCGTWSPVRRPPIKRGSEVLGKFNLDIKIVFVITSMHRYALLGFNIYSMALHISRGCLT